MGPSLHRRGRRDRAVTNQMMADNTMPLASARAAPAPSSTARSTKSPLYDGPLTPSPDHQPLHHRSVRPGDRRRGRHRLRPREPAFNGGLGHGHALPPAGNLRPAGQRRLSAPCSRWATTSTTAGTLAEFQGSYDPCWGRVKSITRPVARQPRVRDARRRRLLRLLQRRRQRHGAARRPRQGLLQLRRRRLAPDRAQLQLRRGRRLRRGLAAGAAGCAPTWPPTRRACTLAYWHHPRFSSGHDGNDARHAAALAGALRRRRRRRARRATTTTTSASRPQDPDAARSTRRAASASSSSAPAATTTTRLRHAAPNSEVRRHDTFGVLRLTLHADELRLAVRARGRQELHRLGHRSLPLSAITPCAKK